MKIPSIKIPSIKIELKTIERWLIYAFIGTIFTFSVLIYLNVSLLKDEATDLKYTQKGQYIPEALLLKAQVELPPNAKTISFSYDHNYVSYINTGIIYIKDLRTGKIVKEIAEEGPITNAFFVSDRNIILYFVLKTKGTARDKFNEIIYQEIGEENLDDEEGIDNYTSEQDIALMEQLLKNQVLLVKTYSMSSGESIEQVELGSANFLRIKQVEYSSLTNVIYVNVEMLQKGKIINTIFRINIMKRVSKYQSGALYTKVVLLSHEDKLIVEDNKNNIYINKSSFKTKEYKKFILIGKDQEDNFYISPVDVPSKILKIKGKDIIEEKIIGDTSFSSIHNNKEGVFLIFKDYIWPLKQDVTPAGIKLNKGNTFLDLFDNVLYEINTKGELKQTMAEEIK
ncbi:MAG TPA: hypothetical protein DCP90_06620 [Clostridiales bacterium]|nr:MAG: hypothetical protein A2Y22_00655 [Clostridiales bacterium GWD2_32_59]HAN10267.1 hypothetical protein [Clostridiales bacterium]